MRRAGLDRVRILRKAHYNISLFAVIAMASKVAAHISSWATWWFAAGERDPRTPEQLEREKWVFWAPWTGRFNRWMTVIPCFAGENRGGLQRERCCLKSSHPPPAPSVQMCIGSLYR